MVAASQRASPNQMAMPDPRSPAQWNQPLFGVEITRCLPRPGRRPITFSALPGAVRPSKYTRAGTPSPTPERRCWPLEPATRITGTGHGAAFGMRFSAASSPRGDSVVATTAAYPAATASLIAAGGGWFNPPPDPAASDTSAILPGPPVSDSWPDTPPGGVALGVQ